MKNTIRSLVRAMAGKPYVGRLLRIVVAVWRGPQTRDELALTRADVELTHDRLAGLTKRFEALSDGYGSAIRGLERSIKRNESSVGREGSQIEDLTKTVAELSEKLTWIAADNDNIRSRLEFVRKELMFELRKQVMRVGTGKKEGSASTVRPKIINLEKVNGQSRKRLNLGCGHIPLDDFINVDSRELPGVDLIASVTALPFDPNTVGELYASHLIEHFSNHELKSVVLPHWFSLLESGGVLSVIAPDADAMIKGYSQGEFAFAELREVLFGGQEYEGDFHFTMLNPEGVMDLLEEIGFTSPRLVAKGRRNGLCYEFEITATKR